MSAEAGAALPAPVLDRLMELADFYSAGTALPGRAVGLLRRVIETCGADNLQPSDILATLCDSSKR